MIGHALRKTFMTDSNITIHKRGDILKDETKFQLDRFQEICIQFGYQQAICMLKVDSNTKALIHSASVMNAEKKSLSTAIEDD